MQGGSGRIVSPTVNLVFYALLLVATPFLLLQRYLPQAIGMASRAGFTAAGHHVPWVVAVAVVLLLALLPLAWRHITRIRLIAMGVVLLLMILGQRSTDWYFNHEFYELQHNWHYIAYMLFAFVFYRVVEPRGWVPARVVLVTFVAAAGISAFDEIAQVFISGRIFDICDVANDMWGALMGLIVVLFVVEEGRTLAGDRTLRPARVRLYLEHPLALLVQALVFTYLLLAIGSILTALRYWPVAVGLSLAAYGLVFLVFHFSQRRIWAGVLLVVAIAALAAQTVSFLRHRNEHIVRCDPGLIVYRGIPLPYFDVLITPNGVPRFVDKKLFFNNKDKVNRIYHLATDILVIGSGSAGQGGQGFGEEGLTHFTYNPVKNRALQVIVLPTPLACDEFNRIKAAGRSVMCILHNG